MRDVFGEVSKLLESGTDVVLVMIVESSGSTPRRRGAKMLVTGLGRVYGTIGGGRVEYVSIQKAQQVLKERTSQIAQYQLSKNDIQDLGMICGGDVKVYFQLMNACDIRWMNLCRQIESVYQNRERCWLLTDAGTDAREAMKIVSGKPELLHQTDVFAEELVLPQRVWVFGGGHVAQALVPVLASVGFSCVVLEDREEFCKKELFPEAENTMLIDNDKVAEYVSVKAEDYAVIMTRGHKDDQKIQAQMLETPASYIGVIGSLKKKAAVFENLRRMGYTDTDLARITAPIGLAIKAETPAEIAVSIAAQLIMLKNS